MPASEVIGHESLAPLIEHAAQTALLFDVDGTLAPIVAQTQDARVPEEVSRLLGGLARRYSLVACVSGRRAAEAKRLVGVGAVTYAGSHGAELLAPGTSAAEVGSEFERWRGRIEEFVGGRDLRLLRRIRVRIEDKAPIWAFHWRGAPDEDVAHAAIEQIARDAGQAGLAVHWGRKVLEVRPPIPFDKGGAVRELIRRSGASMALYAGDDLTDVDAFDALHALRAEGVLDHVLAIGVRSDETPERVRAAADLLVTGTPGVLNVLRALAA